MKESLIPHSKPSISEADMSAVLQVLRSGNIVQGRQVEKFEDAVSNFIGHRGGVATHSGTSALHLSLIALGIAAGDEVALPSFVCTAPLHAVRYINATPLFIDINPETFNMDSKDLKGKISHKTKAIILPHMFGLPADLDEIMECEIPLIEDCAHSIGAKYMDERAGNFGILSVYSFYATKMISTGEGGMITSHSPELLEQIRDMRDYDKKDEWKVRYNYKMTDFQAAMGIEQLSQLPEFILKRKTIAKRYSEEFRDLPLVLPSEPKDRSHIFYRYIIRVDKNLLEIREKLQKQGIACERPVYKPLHQYFNISVCPHAELVWKSSLSLPIYPSLSDEETEKIIRAIKRVFL